MLWHPLAAVRSVEAEQCKQESSRVFWTFAQSLLGLHNAYAGICSMSFCLVSHAHCYVPWGLGNTNGKSAGRQACSHPLLVVGAGANRKLTSNMLRKFVDEIGIPFCDTMMGKGVIDSRARPRRPCPALNKAALWTTAAAPTSEAGLCLRSSLPLTWSHHMRHSELGDTF